MPDPRKFIATTDYPMPFLVYSATTDFVATAQTYIASITIAHGLPFIPLLIGQWSINSSFQPSYDLTFDILGFAGNLPTVTIQVYADATNVYISWANYTNTDEHIYLRLTAFTPPSYTGLVTAVDDNSPFKFNSDFNYIKIYMAGSLTLAADTDQTINHGLGYLPQCRVWKSVQGNNSFSPMVTNTSGNGLLLGAAITDQTLILGNHDADPFSQHDVTYIYQIYADEV